LFPKFRLRWKGNHEGNYSLKSNETILLNLKPVEKIQNLTVIDWDDVFIWWYL